MKKIIMIFTIMFVVLGCSSKTASIECKECQIHFEDSNSIADCNNCSIDYKGKMKEGNILPSLPSLPNSL